MLEVENVKIDIGVTHTAPSFCPPHVKNNLEYWCTYDKNLANDVHDERQSMDNLYNYLIEHGHPLLSWYYGHYHSSAVYLQGNTCFELLDIMELCTVDE